MDDTTLPTPRASDADRASDVGELPVVDIPDLAPMDSSAIDQALAIAAPAPAAPPPLASASSSSSMTAPVQERRGRGRPPGAKNRPKDGGSSSSSSSSARPGAAPGALHEGVVKGASYRHIKSKETLRAELRKRDRELEEQRRQLEQLTAMQTAGVDPAGMLGNAIGETFGMGFAFLASMRGSHWTLSADEKARLGALWGPALGRYMGRAAAHAPIIAAATATAAIILPRMAADADAARALGGSVQ